MKKFIAMTAACYLMAGCVPVFAGDDFAFNLTSDFYSKYVWRGQLLNDDPVFQPGISVGYKGFTFGVWGNADLTNYTGNSGEFTEFDYTLSYSGKFNPDGKLGYTLGVVHYQFPSSFLDTTEIFWGLTYDTFLSPSITLYHDIDEAGGATYASFGISHTIENIIKVSEKTSANLVLGATLGWGSSEYNEWYWANANDSDKSVTRSAFNDLALKASLPFALANGWSITPSISYVILVDGRIRDADTYAKSGKTNGSNYFVAGVSIGKSF
ncbi:MAG TPA: hypothetical protein DDW84_02775 [Phycisphaerales bacterium]|nr:MAG: hypothetical protein A2Y13_00190 [Planctomycetes bacterium GWC2_45_44]HBG77762.1 hypothetical protein [Phycisphaerales bacterium]HBR20228.1 hypothetical protein [Phycisphaerales bacterium]